MIKINFVFFKYDFFLLLAIDIKINQNFCDSMIFFFQEKLSDKVAMFDQYANKHKDKQNKNPFTSGLNIEKQKFSKDEYGR